MPKSKHLWYFPEDTTCQIKGINSLKFDSSDSSTGKLIREICQNSCDARNGNNKVRIEFDRFTIPRDDFPDIDNFEKTLILCEKAGHSSKADRTAVNVFKGMIKKLEENKITVLRASDFGTSGACGSTNNNPIEYTPWTSMTIGKGISDKGANSGGSFGRGKESFFSVSDFHTVFYSTNDIEGHQASIGCSELMTHYDESNHKKDGFGICGNSNNVNNYSIPSSFALGNFERRPNEFGTDLYILGYHDEDDCWSDMILIHAIKNFFIKIVDDELEVTVAGTTLNKNTIVKLTTAFKSKYTQESENLDLILEQINLYQNNNPVYSDERIDIYLSKSENQHYISSIRSGMVIEQSFVRSSNIVGLLKITNDETSKILCKCEPTPHDKWNLRNINNATPSESKLIRSLVPAFKEIIEQEIEKLKGIVKNETLDAEGVEKYLSFTTETSDQIAISRKEYAWSPINKIKHKKKKRKINHEDEPPKGETPETLPASSTDEADGGVSSGRTNQTNNKGGEEPHPFAPNPEGDMVRVFKLHPSVSMSNIVPLCGKTTDNQIVCNLMFNINKESEYYIAIGAEMSDNHIAENIPLVSVFDINGNKIDLIDQYHAGPIISKRGQNNILTITLDYPTICNIIPVVLSYDN